MMNGQVQFETPENIRVSYRLAGPGTRFVAWVVDNILLWLFTIVIAVPILLLFGAALEVFVRDLMGKDNVVDDHPALFALGIFWLIFSLSGFIYFGLSELLLRGQTIGKRQSHIRVVKSDGFALDPLCILVRTLFRVVDHLPPLWLIPVFNQKLQRLGDVVAGTVVVVDEPSSFSAIQELLDRGYADCEFHFDARMLSRARPQDINAVERVLERWESLSEADRESLLERLVVPLAARLQVDAPAPEQRRRFLEDFLAAEYRRQHRQLG
jgi:uncharacterized RDD family membrane protein YckC